MEEDTANTDRHTVNVRNVPASVSTGGGAVVAKSKERRCQQLSARAAAQPVQGVWRCQHLSAAGAPAFSARVVPSPVGARSVAVPSPTGQHGRVRSGCKECANIYIGRTVAKHWSTKMHDSLQPLIKTVLMGVLSTLLRQQQRQYQTNQRSSTWGSISTHKKVPSAATITQLLNCKVLQPQDHLGKSLAGQMSLWSGCVVRKMPTLP